MTTNSDQNERDDQLAGIQQRTVATDIAERPEAPEAPRETRPLPAVSLEETPAESPGERPASAPESDPDATIIAAQVRAPEGSRPRRNTLASMTRPRASEQSAPQAHDAENAEPDQSREGTPSQPRGFVRSTVPSQPLGSEPVVTEGIVDELDEWSVADQPTVVMTPGMLRKKRPDYLQTGEMPRWPSPQKPEGADARPTMRPTLASQRPRAAVNPLKAAGATGATGAAGNIPLGPRLAAPDGRPMPGTPPAGVPRSALPNPRMQRFQELRAHRVAHEQGAAAPDEPLSVADTVRQWWRDIAPSLRTALNYQHEAKASGLHPIPAHAEDAPAGGRLGDAFGRLTATAREMTERAQHAAAPTIKRISEQAEQARTFLEQRLDGNPARQQAPFLGPGRVAIFFRQGVTVGQAQRLLSASQARPLRIIPRKHGFLALVRPGTEADVADRLRQHPYVRDVAYLEYDEHGEAMQ